MAAAAARPAHALKRHKPVLPGNRHQQEHHSMRTTVASTHPCGWRSSLPAAGAVHRRCKLRPAGEAGSRFNGIGRAVPARRQSGSGGGGRNRCGPIADKRRQGPCSPHLALSSAGCRTWPNVRLPAPVDEAGSVYRAPARPSGNAAIRQVFCASHKALRQPARQVGHFVAGGLTARRVALVQLRHACWRPDNPGAARGRALGWADHILMRCIRRL